MKKLLIALALAVASFSASAATYDFADENKFGASVEAQAKVEGISEEVFAEKFGKYVEALTAKNAEKLAASVPADKQGTAEAQALAVRAVLDMLKADMGTKTLKEILEIK